VPTVWAVADSDSYLKWSAATLAALPPGWDGRQLVVRTPIQPSAAQAGAATGGQVPVLGVGRLVAQVSAQHPDVLLLACTGPVVAALAALPVIGSRRHLLVTGLPGISVPASPRAVRLRAGCDLLVVHSRRERVEFSRLADELAPGLVVGLARLPFLTDPEAAPTVPNGSRSDVVFAAQAQVPPGREQRQQVLRSLAALRPAGSAVVKLRGTADEPQTHAERYPYPALWVELVARGEVPGEAVRFESGSMSEALARARALVTVSSTAALEAIAADREVLVLTDFGVSADLVNLVFADSGCLGSLADLRQGRFRRPSPAWWAENYGQPAAENDWLTLVEAMLARPRQPPRRRRGRRRGRARTPARMLLPGWVGRSLSRWSARRAPARRAP
jgi:hypothetical protein